MKTRPRYARKRTQKERKKNPLRFTRNFARKLYGYYTRMCSRYERHKKKHCKMWFRGKKQYNEKIPGKNQTPELEGHNANSDHFFFRIFHTPFENKILRTEILVRTARCLAKLPRLGISLQLDRITIFCCSDCNDNNWNNNNGYILRVEYLRVRYLCTQILIF